MRIICSDAGKRFNRDWIFRNFTYEFSPANKYAVTGPNGSGKSTLLQVLSSSMAVNHGTVQWQLDNTIVNDDTVFQHFAIAAPYLDIIEEMTASEFLQFHHQFKPLIQGHTIKQIISMIGLEKAADKQIRYYSSGMKQRLKLAQAIFSDVPLLLLDEPCTNLDTAGIQLYNHLVKTFCSQKTIIVSSNDKNEYGFCNQVIVIQDYK